MKHYKFIIAALILSLCTPVNASISEIFENTDVNTVRADISKHFITKGARVSHGQAYNSDTLQVAEPGREGRNTIIKNYVFRFTPVETGTKVEMTLYKTISGSTPRMADLMTEQQAMEQIKASMQGKFLYGLGFDFDMYDTPNGRIKAPKGRDTGIKLTLVKYDAQLKGLMAGDVIVEINNTPLNEIPIEKYATALFAKTMTDSLTLTVKRGNAFKTVTLTPRASTRKVF